MSDTAQPTARYRLNYVRAQQAEAEVARLTEERNTLRAALPEVGGEADDELHTGDDDLLDMLTSIRSDVECVIEFVKGDEREATLDTLADILEELNKADVLRVAELKAFRAALALGDAPKETQPRFQRHDDDAPLGCAEGMSDTAQPTAKYRIWAVHCPFKKNGFPSLGT